MQTFINCSAPANELLTVFKSLVQSSRINNFRLVKSIAYSSDKQTLNQLFISAVRTGVIRDVQLYLPIMISNEQRAEINEAFCVAAENAHMAIMNLFIENGITVNFDDDLPLRRAVCSGNVEPVEFLLKKGANVHVCNDELILMCCRSGDYPQIIETLVSHGINIFVHYKMALNTCLEKKFDESAAVLIRCSNEKPKEMKRFDISEFQQDMSDFVQNNDPFGNEKSSDDDKSSEDSNEKSDDDKKTVTEEKTTA